MTGRLPFSLLSALAWGQLSSALVPADPTITAPAILPRQNNDRFIGWVESNGTWYSETCNAGGTWFQDGKYAQCCPTTLASCYAPTACVGGSLIYPLSDQSTTTTIACTENFDNTLYSICNTAFIFENFGDSNPRTDIVCGESSVNWSYYRKIPASETEKVSSDLPSSIAKPISSGSSAPGPTNSSEPEEKKDGGSKAWIAGAVVGPIVGLAIIGAIIFFLVRRKRNNKNSQAGATAPANQQPPVAQYNEGKPTYNQQGTYVQPGPGYNPNDPYNQQGYSPQPLSPAPQYSGPYNAPGSPPPQGAYAPEKHNYAAPTASHPQAAELGGVSTPSGGSNVMELSGDSNHR